MFKTRSRRALRMTCQALSLGSVVLLSAAVLAGGGPPAEDIKKQVESLKDAISKKVTEKSEQIKAYEAVPTDPKMLTEKRDKLKKVQTDSDALQSAFEKAVAAAKKADAEQKEAEEALKKIADQESEEAKKAKEIVDAKTAAAKKANEDKDAADKAAKTAEAEALKATESLKLMDAAQDKAAVTKEKEAVKALEASRKAVEDLVAVRLVAGSVAAEEASKKVFEELDAIVKKGKEATDADLDLFLEKASGLTSRGELRKASTLLKDLAGTIAETTPVKTKALLLSNLFRKRSVNVKSTAPGLEVWRQLSIPADVALTLPQELPGQVLLHRAAGDKKQEQIPVASAGTLEFTDTGAKLVPLGKESGEIQRGSLTLHNKTAGALLISIPTQLEPDDDRTIVVSKTGKIQYRAGTKFEPVTQKIEGAGTLSFTVKEKKWTVENFKASQDGSGQLLRTIDAAIVQFFRQPGVTGSRAAPALLLTLQVEGEGGAAGAKTVEGMSGDVFSIPEALQIAGRLKQRSLSTGYEIMEITPADWQDSVSFIHEPTTKGDYILLATAFQDLGEYCYSAYLESNSDEDRTRADQFLSTSGVLSAQALAITDRQKLARTGLIYRDLRRQADKVRREQVIKFGGQPGDKTGTGGGTPYSGPTKLVTMYYQELITEPNGCSWCRWDCVDVLLPVSKDKDCMGRNKGMTVSLVPGGAPIASGAGPAVETMAPVEGSAAPAPAAGEPASDVLPESSGPPAPAPAPLPDFDAVAPAPSAAAEPVGKSVKFAKFEGKAGSDGASSTDDLKYKVLIVNSKKNDAPVVFEVADKSYRLEPGWQRLFHASHPLKVKAGSDEKNLVWMKGEAGTGTYDFRQTKTGWELVAE